MQQVSNKGSVSVLDSDFSQTAFWLLGENWLFAVIGVGVYEAIRIFIKGWKLGIADLGWRYWVILPVLLMLAVFVCRISGDVPAALAVWMGMSVPSTLGIIFVSRTTTGRTSEVSERDPPKTIRVDDIRLGLAPKAQNKWARALSKYFLNMYY